MRNLLKIFSGKNEVQKTSESTSMVVHCTTALVKAAYTPDKPTMSIFPIDRMFLESYITKAYGALVSSGADKTWAKNKTLEWKSMGHPRSVIPDILKYVNIQLVATEPFRYFSK